MVVLFAVFWGAAYMTTNHFPLREPARLPFLPFEAAIPFLAWTVPVYLSAFPQAVSAAWLLDRRNLARLTAAAFWVVAVHAAIFALFPTTYPRPADPPIASPFIDWLYGIMRGADTPGNCFPSLHVSMTLLISLALMRSRPRLGAAFLFWSLGIVISTVTTKQHYAVDAFGGAAIALAAYHLAFRSDLNLTTKHTNHTK